MKFSIFLSLFYLVLISRISCKNTTPNLETTGSVSTSVTADTTINTDVTTGSTHVRSSPTPDVEQSSSSSSEPLTTFRSHEKTSTEPSISQTTELLSFPKFLKEPEDKLDAKEESSVTFACVVDVPVTDCYWVKNGRKIRLESLPNYEITGNKDKGECNLKIKKVDFQMDQDSEWFCSINSINFSRKAHLRVLTNIKGPFYQINGLPEITHNQDFIIDGNQSVIIKIYAQNAFPLFTTDNLQVYINGVRQNLPIFLEESKEKPNTNNIETLLSIEKVDHVVYITMTLFHPSLFGKKTTRLLMLRPTNVPLPIIPVSTKVLVNGKDVKFSFPNAFLTPSVIKWFQKDLQTNKWNFVKESYSPSYTVKPLSKPGLQIFKMTVNQPDYYNINATSPELSVLTYAPLANVRITSPLFINISSVPSKVTLSLECEADGDPKPEIFWVKASKDGLKKINQPSVTIGESTSDVGKYKCEAIQHLFTQRVLQVAPSVVTVTLQD